MWISPRALLILSCAAFLLVFLLLLALYRMRRNRRAAHRRAPGQVAAEEEGEPTGVWGVGGPAMREPGSTGLQRVPTADRRYENRDE